MTFQMWCQPAKLISIHTVSEEEYFRKIQCECVYILLEKKSLGKFTMFLNWMEFRLFYWFFLVQCNALDLIYLTNVRHHCFSPTIKPIKILTKKMVQPISNWQWRRRQRRRMLTHHPRRIQIIQHHHRHRFKVYEINNFVVPEVRPAVELKRWLKRWKNFSHKLLNPIVPGNLSVGNDFVW